MDSIIILIDFYILCSFVCVCSFLYLHQCNSSAFSHMLSTSASIEF
jgi:hypothetical protein